MNEELQSINQEMQTSREELQSVNDELQRLMEELNVARSDLQNLVQSSQVPTLFLDQQLRIRKFTPAIEGLAALQEKDLGSPLKLAAPDLALPPLLNAAGEAMRCLKTQEEQLWLESQQAWFNVRVTPYRTMDGTVLGAVMTFTDITDLKRAEMSGRLLASIVESSDDAIASKDLNGIITSWNKGAERLLGYKPEEIIGKPVITFIPPERHPEEALILERLRRGERIDHFETVRQRKDGTLVDVSLTVSPIKDRQGKIVGASKIARDITPRKQAERLLSEARARLAQANLDLEQRVQQRTKELADSNSQLETLVYSIAHDLRAPLRAMQSFSTMLIDEYSQALGAPGQDYARRIMRSAESLDQLILDLLAYARLGQSTFELTRVNLEACWSAALAQNAGLVESQKAIVETVPPLLAVLAHPATLTQVLSNLLNNALRFVPADRPPQIRLRTEPCAEVVRVWVEDNGIGIDPKHHERVFAVFQQLHGKKFGGTGVGLAIVRRSIERMGGRVGLVSAPGQGTRFWFELAAADGN